MLAVHAIVAGLCVNKFKSDGQLECGSVKERAGE
jgi:hypothetical protein